MPWYLGIDTSNYTTSTALFDSETGGLTQQKRLLPVEAGKLGLRQSDAVFLHVRQLGSLLEDLLTSPHELAAVGTSKSPRDDSGSYMPCFLVGDMAGTAVASALHIPRHSFSHQAGHLMAALWGAGRMPWARRPFLAFHLSGGTTQCLLARPHPEMILHITTVCETLDLNAGQVVDRVGGMLGLPFPAGPALETLADNISIPERPRPTFRGGGCCLSGVENQCARMLEQGKAGGVVAAWCLSYLGETVLEMTRRALADHPGLPLVYAGGVMANRQIRKTVVERYPEAAFAPAALSADNAAGTAVLAALRSGERIMGVPPC